MLSSLPRRLVRNAVRRSNFHQSTSVIEDPLGLDKDYGKDSVVRAFFFFSLPSATSENRPERPSGISSKSIGQRNELRIELVIM